MAVTLTEGAVVALIKNEGVDVGRPVLQVLKIGEVPAGSARPPGPPRYRLMMSDGVHSSIYFMLASQINDLMERMAVNCVCRLNKTTTSTLADGRRVVVILEMDVMKSAEEIGDRIGNPTPYSVHGTTKSPQKPTSSTAASPQKPSPSKPMSSPSVSPQKFSPSKSWSSSSSFSPQKRAPSPSFSSPEKRSGGSSFSPEKKPTLSSFKFASPTATRPGPSNSFTSASPGSGRGRGRGSVKSETPPRNTPPESPTKVIPIQCLNPYQTKWSVRARVINKSSVRNWSNSKGEGKLFSFEIMDESGEIRVTAFNKEVDAFFTLVEQGKVYLISKGTLKPANKQYTTVKNDYEMTLNSTTTIVACDDDEGLSVPVLQCDFVPISELENRDPDAIIDVIGVCRSVEEVSRITTKAGKEVSKRELSLMDTSEREVRVTLWGEQAEKFDGSAQPVVAVKSARLSDFGGRSLSVLFSSTVMVNPDIPEAFSLRGWYDREGHALSSQSLTQTWSPGGVAKVNWRFLGDDKDGPQGRGEVADYFSCVATVVTIRKENCMYQACPRAECNKKVTDLQNGKYRCEKCDREFSDFKYRLILAVNLADFGDNRWVTCFQDTAEVLLGHNAEALGHLRDTDEAAFDDVFSKAFFTTHIFKNRAKLETYNDESRLKTTVLQIQPVDHREYSRRLISNIRRMASCDDADLGPPDAKKPSSR